MKSDLDRLMQSAGIDALLVTGPSMHNPDMVYFTGVAHVSQADMIKRRGHSGVLFHAPMERDEAAKSGLELCSYSNYSLMDLLRESGNDRKMAVVLRYQHMLADAGVTSGRVALYGKTDLGQGYAQFKNLQEAMPSIEFVGDLDEDVLMAAMSTKDADEIERIRQMGKVTTRVVGSVADFLSSRPVKNGVLVGPDGDPLTIGEVKGRMALWLAEGGAEDPEGTIFAIGHDAGVPHSAGNPQDVLRLGQTIVFDIYPCEAGGGYFYDFTRTWCLGYAPDDAQALYEQVLAVYHQVMSELKVNTPFSDYQRRTCELFEAQGHPTVMTNPQTDTGYVHSVGHGVGLHIHERPFSRTVMASETDILAPGSVITIEPGLYYPERGMGVRLEDTVYVRPDGTFEIPTGYPLDLVLPVGR
jgi:Xaa-Pro aminopeptidase